MAVEGYRQEEDIVGKAYDARLMRRLLKYLSPYKYYIILSTLLLIFATLMVLAGPLLTKIAIDNHITTGNLDGLSIIVLLYAAILVAQFILQYLQTYIIQWVGQKTMYDLRMEVFSHIDRLGLSFFDKNPVGRLVTRATSDIQALNELFTSGVVAIFGDVIMLAGIVVIMLMLNWELALVSMIVIPLIFISTMIFRSRVREAFRRIRTRVARVNSFIQEHVSGMWVVQSFVAEKRTFGKFDDINSDLRNNHLKSVLYFAVFFPVIEILGAVSVALVIWYGGIQNIREMLTLGALVAFLQYVERFFSPIRDLSEKYNILQQAMASSERIFRLLDEKPDIADPEEPVLLPDIKGAIEFKNLWFAYNDEEWILKDINLKIEPGERIAVVGATGAGKTSTISLLLRFYEFQKGSVTLDGVSIRDFAIDDYRKYFALVLQDIFMFSGDIGRNIRLGNEEISDDDIEEALRIVGADSFVNRLEGGLSHVLSERGANLSVGQRQLLAFARALAFKPKILILDEATSSVDTETEILIQKAMERLLTGRTSIIIAHRLSTIKNCDRIVVMHKGQIKEVGTHAQLLAEGGIYHRLYQLQYKDQEIPAEVT